MKTLVVEDDFVSRRLLQTILSAYGTCDVAVNGNEALHAFRLGHRENAPYDLVCLDIMMPGMDGQEALRQIREEEESRGIYGRAGVKIVMTTSLSEFEPIMDSFRNQCDAYLIKPVEKGPLVSKLTELGVLR